MVKDLEYNEDFILSSVYIGGGAENRDVIRSGWVTSLNFGLKKKSLIKAEIVQEIQVL